MLALAVGFVLLLLLLLLLLVLLLLLGRGRPLVEGTGWSWRCGQFGRPAGRTSPQLIHQGQGKMIWERRAHASGFTHVQAQTLF